VTQHETRGKKARRNRIAGYICYVGASRSGVFWAIIKDSEKVEHFAYGRNFLTFPAIPRIGQQVTFIRLPPLPSSKFPRAIEVIIQRAHNSISHSSKK
jgi:hypothetical protein